MREIEGSEAPRRGRPTRGEVSVIRGWADALRAGLLIERRHIVQWLRQPDPVQPDDDTS